MSVEKPAGSQNPSGGNAPGKSSALELFFAVFFPNVGITTFFMFAIAAVNLGVGLAKPTWQPSLASIAESANSFQAGLPGSVERAGRATIELERDMVDMAERLVGVTELGVKADV